MDNYKELFAKNGLLYNVLAELLKDNTTNKNIVWATDTCELPPPNAKGV